MRRYDEDEVIVEEEGGGTISAFLWGALIGAGAMLLFAPRSGEETRRELGDSLRRMRDTAEGAFRDMQETVADTVRDARSTVETRVDATRSAFEAGRDAARGAKTDLGQRWEQGREGVRSAYRPRPGAPARESEEE
ncbi:MAG TPA: YtxH domain-containing protein [Longimicrobiales bacterium]